jgi:hypothetical protein
MVKGCVGVWWRRELAVVVLRVEADIEGVGTGVDIGVGIVVDIEADTEAGTEVGTGFDAEVDTVDIEVEAEGDCWSTHLISPCLY